MTSEHYRGDGADSHVEVRRNEDGALDEIVVTNGFTHLEQMDENLWWCSFDGIHVWFRAENGPLAVEWFNDSATQEERVDEIEKAPRQPLEDSG